MKKKAVELKTESVEGRLKLNKIKQEDDWSVKTEESCIQTETRNSKLPKICFTER